MCTFWQKLPEPAVVLNLLCIFFISLDLSFSRELPNNLPVCKRNDKTVSDCLRKVTAILRPNVAEGIPKYHIPAIDPLMIPMVMLEQGTPAVNYKAKLKNLKIFGLRNYEFTKLNAYPKKLMFDGELEIPMLWLESNYDIDGRALVVPIKGNGIFKANLTDVTINVDVACKVVKRKGEDYLDIKSIRTKFNTLGATANFDNLFNGDETLSKATNTFLNDNAKDIVDEIKPAIEALISMLAEEIISKTFATIPYAKILPPN